MKILAEIPLRKGFESERFQVSTALFQHVNELRAGSKVPGFQRCGSVLDFLGLEKYTLPPTITAVPITFQLVKLC